MVCRCKMMISPEFFFFIFFIFSFFFFFEIWFSGLLGQKIAQKDKKLCLLCLVSHEPYIIWSSFLVHNCKMIIYPGGIFYFFKFFIFSIVRRVKGLKIAHNDKKICLLHFISQEPYIIWSSFMVHMCKKIISLVVFYIFSKF